MEELKDRVVFVAGGGSGIGEGAAQAFAEAGCRVAVADIDQASAEAAAARLTAAGARAVGLALDVAEPEAWRRAAAAAETALGPIDVLVNSAGVLGALVPLAEMPLARLRRLYEITVFGVVNGVQCMVPRMAGRGGHIVSVASIGGLDPLPKLADYCSAKAAVVAMSLSLADELAGQGIGVSVVCPGRVATRLAETTARQLGEPLPATPPPAARSLAPIEVGRRIVEAVRAGRFYVFTHAENRERVAARIDLIEQGFAALDG